MSKSRIRKIFETSIKNYLLICALLVLLTCGTGDGWQVINQYSDVPLATFEGSVNENTIIQEEILAIEVIQKAFRTLRDNDLYPFQLEDYRPLIILRDAGAEIPLCVNNPGCTRADCVSTWEDYVVEAYNNDGIRGMCGEHYVFILQELDRDIRSFISTLVHEKMHQYTGLHEHSEIFLSLHHKVRDLALSLYDKKDQNPDAIPTPAP